MLLGFFFKVIVQEHDKLADKQSIVKTNLKTVKMFDLDCIYRQVDIHDDRELK